MSAPVTKSNELPGEPVHTSARAQPESLADLFISFTWLALQGFGGVLAVVQQELVERKRWLTKEEFVEEWAVAQIMPGPNVVNLSLMLGGRYFGWRGALAAAGGLLSLPLCLILLLALGYAQYGNNPLLIGALRGMGAVAAGLIIAAGLRLFGAVKRNPLGIPVCVGFGLVCFVCIALLRWPLAYVLPTLGCASCLLVYWKLKP